MFFRLCTIGLLFLLPISAAKAVQVEVSIRPLALIIEPLLLEGDSVEVLVRSGASPHDYALKASDLKRINSADLLVWTGPELERFLVKPLRQKPAHKLLTLSKMPSMHWPHLDTEELEFDHKDDHAHEHGDRDPHFWLDPHNAKYIAKKVSERLVLINPKHKEEYSLRLSSFLAQVEQLQSVLSAALKPYSHVGFAVFHRGYDHFVGRYQLNQLAYITLSPEQKPGARHLYELRKNLAGSAACVFIERGSNMRAAENLATDLGIDTAMLDPLGVDSRSYNDMMLQMAATFTSCLTGSNEQLTR